MWRRQPAARRAGTLLGSRFFRPDAYSDRRSPSFWKKLAYPFQWTAVLSSLDALSLLGFDCQDVVRRLAHRSYDGTKITRLTPVQGFCAETGGALTLFLATWLGIPVSTTHTITGAIVGVGAARKVSAVRWNVTVNIVVAWVITIPAAALISMFFYGIAALAI
jgi:hypothetical protein